MRRRLGKKREREREVERERERERINDEVPKSPFSLNSEGSRLAIGWEQHVLVQNLGE